MMKRELILIRHTKSSWKDLLLNDFDRPLKKSRIDDADEMGKTLADLDLAPDLVICSAALRTRQTAEHLLNKLKYDTGKVQYERRIYEATAKQVMEVIRETDDTIKTLVIIGHNPSLTHLANMFIKPPILELPTTGVVWVELESIDWQIYEATPGKLKYFLTPAQSED